MSLAKIDPIETWYAVGSSLIGRVLLFFSGGWVGLFLGRIAAAFHSIEDFRHPLEAFGDISMVRELLVMVFWPVATVISAISVHVLLFFAALIFVGVVFVVFLYTEEPAPVWWLGIVLFTSLIPVLAWKHEQSLVSWVVLLVFWAGLGAVGWWALKRYHPEVVERVGDLIQGRDEPEVPATPRRKAPPDTWGKPVKGWDGDEGESDSEPDRAAEGD